jgi:hypothetical protein
MTPVQLENVDATHYLDSFRVLLLSYHGLKPLGPDVHRPLTDWVKRGGVLVVIDDDADPYNRVREWWNSDGRGYATPREHLFDQLGLTGNKLGEAKSETGAKVGSGGVIWLRENPAKLAATTEGDTRLVAMVKQAAQRAGMKWRETNYLLLRRGPYLIAAGLDESVAGAPKELHGKFVNLFDPALRVSDAATLAPASRLFLLDLATVRGREPRVLASACKALATKRGADGLSLTIEGVGSTPAVILIHSLKRPSEIRLSGQVLEGSEYSLADKLLWIRFANEAAPRELTVRF